MTRTASATLALLAVAAAAGGAAWWLRTAPPATLDEPPPPGTAPAPAPAAAARGAPAPAPLSPNAGGPSRSAPRNPLPRIRALGGRWIEVPSRRFHCIAAAEVGEVRVREQGQLLDAVFGWLEDTYDAATLDGPIYAAVLKDRAQMQAVADALGLQVDAGRVLGFYSPEWNLVAAYDREGLDSTLLHEGYHAYLGHRAKGSVPTWFNEGHATYYGTAQWKNFQVRFRDHHLAAFQGLRGVVLAGRWIPLGDLLRMSPAEFYAPAVAPRAYLQSYALVFTLTHLADPADRTLMERARAAVLDGKPVELDAALIDRTERLLLQRILDLRAPAVPDLAERLAALAPELAAAREWHAIAERSQGPAGSGIERLPESAAARRTLANALMRRLVLAVGGREPVRARTAARALVRAGVGQPILERGRAAPLAELSAWTGLRWPAVLQAVRTRVPKLPKPAWERTDALPARTGQLATAAELVWILESAARAELRRGKPVPRGVATGYAALTVAPIVAFYGSATVLERERGDDARTAHWDGWARLLEARCRAAGPAAPAAAEARVLGRLAAGGDARSRSDLVHLASLVPDAATRAELLAPLPPAVPGVADAMREIYWSKQSGFERAIPWLARSGWPVLAEQVADLLNGGSAAARVAVLESAEHLESGVTTIENLTADADEHVRRAAYEALAGYPGDRTTTLLLRAVRFERGAVQLAATGALLRLLHR